MPIPLPDDRKTLRRIIDDASAVAAAVEDSLSLWRRVRAGRGFDTPEWHDDYRRLCELVGTGEIHGPRGPRMRIQPYLGERIPPVDPNSFAGWMQNAVLPFVAAGKAPVFLRQLECTGGIELADAFRHDVVTLLDAAASKLSDQRPAPVPAGPPDRDGSDGRTEGEPTAGSVGSAPGNRQAATNPPRKVAPLAAVDYKALATALRKVKKRTPAALVEFMANKEEATSEDIARHVHDDPETTDSAIWNNAQRTSDALAAMGSPLSFRFVSGRIYREISPE